MTEFIFLLGLASPFLLMLWLTWARRRAQAKVAAQHHEAEPQNRFATEDVHQDEAGNILKRPHRADHELDPEDTTGGEGPGIRALQGRR